MGVTSFILVTSGRFCGGSSILVVTQLIPGVCTYMVGRCTSPASSAELRMILFFPVRSASSHEISSYASPSNLKPFPPDTENMLRDDTASLMVTLEVILSVPKHPMLTPTEKPKLASFRSIGSFLSFTPFSSSCTCGRKMRSKNLMQRRIGNSPIFQARAYLER